MDRAEASRITVSVVCSPRPGETVSVNLSLPTGAAVQDAIDAGGVSSHLTPAGVGIWGKPGQPGDPLRDRDRVELYRPLLIDPMEARRARQLRQKATR